MNSKKLISGLLVSIAILTASCTNDDYEMPEIKNGKSEFLPKDNLKNEIRTVIKDSTQIKETYADDDGEPSNPKPPKK
ncbi:hypothetical protein [Flavobacterium sp. CSZ]|uniref:hypothetical protein n=1 Tax=Flavobacterium sp. CSZ TaxID=2783791 RepID=UPI00188D1984|nr:hypothetical protein [Flavobacterium sp. CSZ]MBF4487706.1 hypothetical protein [Flavobacterium sp. CSZ]